MSSRLLTLLISPEMEEEERAEVAPVGRGRTRLSGRERSHPVGRGRTRLSEGPTWRAELERTWRLVVHNPQGVSSSGRGTQ